MGVYNDIIEGNYAIADGVAIYRFIAEVDTVKTSIGEIRRGDTIVTGAMISKGSNTICDVLKQRDKDEKFDVKVFSKVKDMEEESTAKDAIINFVYNVPSSGEEQREMIKGELTSRLNDICTGKRILMPVKSGMKCRVNTTGRDNKKITLNIEVNTVKCNVDSESNRLETTVYTEPVTHTNVSNKVQLTQYGNEFGIVDIEKFCDRGQYKNVIEMQAGGYIKPIEFKGNGCHILIDNCFMYSVEDDKIVPIAYWGEGDKLVYSSQHKGIVKFKWFKAIKNYMDTIERHRRFIAPLVLSDTKEVEIA